MSELALRNRQRIRRVDTRLLRRIIRDLLADGFGARNYELCVHLVAAKEMAGINEHFLDHVGSTDVITFNHREESDGQDQFQGELFVCMDDAVAQARQFDTSWQSEIIRYIIHGLLHLCGHDDFRPKARRLMKREENRLLRRMGGRFSLAKLRVAALRRRSVTKNRR